MADKPNGKPSEKDEGGFGGFGQPGQRIVEEINPLTESLAIERKASLLAKSIFMIELVIAIPIVLAFLTFGYIVVLVIVEAGVVALFVGWCKLLEWRARRYEEESYSVTLPIFVCAATAILLAIFWDSLIGIVSLRYRLMYLAMVMTVYFIVPVLASRALLVYRMSGEVSDQNPRKAIDYPKFVFPWSNLGNVAGWSIPKALPAPAPEEKKGWMVSNPGEAGYVTWDFYTPPEGISELDVWNVMKSVSENYDPNKRAFVWPGDGQIPLIGSKKHPKIQKDWRDRNWAKKMPDNSVILLPQGIRAMGKVLSEPKPNGKH